MVGEAEAAAVSSYTLYMLSHVNSSRLSYTHNMAAVLVCREGDTHIIFAQVGFLFSSQDLQSRGLANTIGPHQPQHLTGPGDRQPARTRTHLY